MDINMDTIRKAYSPAVYAMAGNYFYCDCLAPKYTQKQWFILMCEYYMPWNLEMGEYSCLASEVDCYNADKIIIGSHTTVSQKTYLCTASHDISKSNNPLITAPIIIQDQVWVAASAFVGMGITIKQGAVVGATASVYKDVEAWTVVGGNPAKFIKKEKSMISALILTF